MRTEVAKTVTSVLTLPLLYAGELINPSFLPQKNYPLPPGRIYSSTSVYSLSGSSLKMWVPNLGDEVSRKIEAIHRVASQLIEQSADIDPGIISAVDEEFWNLL